jgi:hypothetical protein
LLFVSASRGNEPVWLINRMVSSGGKFTITGISMVLKFFARTLSFVPKVRLPKGRLWGSLPNVQLDAAGNATWPAHTFPPTIDNRPPTASNNRLTSTSSVESRLRG